MHRQNRRVSSAFIVLLLIASVFAYAEPGDSVIEDVYKAELLTFPKQWAFKIGRSGIILVDDQQLDDLTDPDKPVDLGLTGRPDVKSLRQICERAQAAGHRTVILAFDHFFNQYRDQIDKPPRKYMPDRPEMVERVAKISAFAQQYGLGLELSLLSPLEIGPGFRDATGESGLWMHYRKGLRDPVTGTYSVQLWRHTQWSNNKGPIRLEDAGVRVFAFSERSLGNTPYLAVDPASIIEITETATATLWPGTTKKRGDFESVRIEVSGTGRNEIGALDRVLVIQQYRTPELDYFSPSAAPFLTGLVDKYLDSGVKLNGLYSDEMHIQQDWHYFSHHDNGEFAVRYVTPNLSRVYAERYGSEYADLAKYMLYFVHGQEDATFDLTAKEGRMHVFGDSPEEIRRTALFRSRYYELLQNGVVELFKNAKAHAETRIGHTLEARAHATWAQSPTIDKWNVGRGNHQRSQYEYTSNFIWSNTVQQAASACHDYFAWGDFLTGNGNDHAEGGWLDRNYYGLSLACSTGVVNEVPYSYGAHWGMPHELGRRRQSIVDTFGASASPNFMAVQDAEHRDVDVLMLYPLDLVSANERFGSWMSQYAYANLLTTAKLMELGKVDGNTIEVAGRHYTTLVAQFEPFPPTALLELIRKFADGGGRVIWSGPPPVLSKEGNPCLDLWQSIFGVSYSPGADEGLIAPGRMVSFDGALAAVPQQTILTDFLVDRIYPLTANANVEVVARSGEHDIGTHAKTVGGGSLTYLGFRPRDDQSASLGYEVRTWFEILHALGAYPSTGKFPEWNDNTEYVSRNTEYIACRFPNGTTAIARHFKDTVEDWPGGFARNDERDAEYLQRVPPPSESIVLESFKANGQAVTFTGDRALAFRLDSNDTLIAFAGYRSSRIEINGKTTEFAAAPVESIAWAPVTPDRLVPNGAVLMIQVSGGGEIRIPAPVLKESARLVVEGPTKGSRGADVPSSVRNGILTFTVPPEHSGKWFYALPDAPHSGGN